MYQLQLDKQFDVPWQDADEDEKDDEGEQEEDDGEDDDDEEEEDEEQESKDDDDDDDGEEAEQEEEDDEDEEVDEDEDDQPKPKGSKGSKPKAKAKGKAKAKPKSCMKKPKAKAKGRPKAGCVPFVSSTCTERDPFIKTPFRPAARKRQMSWASSTNWCDQVRLECLAAPIAKRTIWFKTYWKYNPSMLFQPGVAGYGWQRHWREADSGIDAKLLDTGSKNTMKFDLGCGVQTHNETWRLDTKIDKGCTMTGTMSPWVKKGHLGSCLTLVGDAKVGDRWRLRWSWAIGAMFEVSWHQLTYNELDKAQTWGNMFQSTFNSLKLLRQLGFKVEAFYMSESDPALLQRLSDLYHPQKLSDDCTKYKCFSF